MDLILGALENAGSRDANEAECAEHASRDFLLDARLDQYILNPTSEKPSDVVLTNEQKVVRAIPPYSFLVHV